VLFGQTLEGLEGRLRAPGLDVFPAFAEELHPLGRIKGPLVRVVTWGEGLLGDLPAAPYEPRGGRYPRGPAKRRVAGTRTPHTVTGPGSADRRTAQRCHADLAARPLRPAHPGCGGRSGPRAGRRVGDGTACGRRRSGAARGGPSSGPPT